MESTLKTIDAYHSESGTVVQFTFDDHQLVKAEYFKSEHGEKIPCERPFNCEKYTLSIDEETLEKQFILEIKNKETGEIVAKLDKTERLNVINGIDLIIRSEDAEEWKNIATSIKRLSKSGHEELKSAILNPEGNGQPSTMDVIAKTVEEILASEKSVILPSFFKNIDQDEEFGIERFVTDRIYHLPDLIQEIELVSLGKNKYIAQSEKSDSSGNSVRFECRYRATSDEEAQKLFNYLATKQVGVWQKIWLACWLLGNRKAQFTYSCKLTELMHTAYPQRDGYFSVGEKIEFYEHLKSIEQTQFVFSKVVKNPKRKKDPKLSYIIPLLTITHEIREHEGDKYPEQLTISLKQFVPEPHEERIYHVGAAIKNKTLELHADDTQLAVWIQARKSQKQDENFITIDRKFLIKLACLEKTDSSNKTVANKYLLARLKRLQEKGVLTEVPEKIQDNVQLRVR